VRLEREQFARASQAVATGLAPVVSMGSSERVPVTPAVLAADRRLRILHVFTRLSHGGMEHGVQKLVAGLDPSRFQHRVCVLRGCDSNVEGLELLQRDLLVAPQAGRGAASRILWLVKAMRSYRPHIVHSRNWGATEAILAAKLARVPAVIHSEHGYEIDMLSGLPWRRRFSRRVFYALTDAVFCVTNDLRDFHAQQAWTNSDKIGVIYNAVDTGRFAPDAGARQATREKLALGDAFTIGAVGRMVAIKDYDTLLAAIGAVVLKGIEVRALLVGDGPELPRLRRLVANSPQLAGRVLWVGASDVVPQLLNAMDVFVQPSLSEGMSNTVLEAMATGLPVLATRTGGNPEIMVEGRYGWLFTPSDAKLLADQIQQLAVAPRMRQELGAAARGHVLEQFGLQRMLDSYTDLYLQLASSGAD
jgi:sugar transferase (PEP-CTERM/EpsH1 system associated)